MFFILVQECILPSMRKLLQIFSVNDPGWGNNHQSGPDRGRDEKDATPPRQEERPRQPQKQDGPPDLDQLWTDFNNRLNNLFKTLLKILFSFNMISYYFLIEVEDFLTFF